MIFGQRSATPADEAFIRAVLAETITLELGASNWPEPLRNQIVPMQVSARYGSVLGSFPDGQSRILQSGGNEAGWIYVAERGDEVRLVEVVVLHAFRGRGVGTAALRSVLDAAGCRPVRLHVRTSNASARRLYERLGFRRTGGDEVQDEMEYRAAAPPC